MKKKYILVVSYKVEVEIRTFTNNGRGYSYESSKILVEELKGLNIYIEVKAIEINVSERERRYFNV